MDQVIEPSMALYSARVIIIIIIIKVPAIWPMYDSVVGLKCHQFKGYKGDELLYDGP